MISWIKGELISSWQVNNKYFVLINCHGLGYEIQTTTSVVENISSINTSKKEIILWLKYIKKEDTDLLFGFKSKDQRDFFIEILNIKGVGSQIGIALLNKYSLKEIINAITENDKNLISSVQGIGQKMTERIILELKEKITTKKSIIENKDENDFVFKNKKLELLFQDIELTLQSLNYPKKEIKNLLPILIKDIKNQNISKKEKKSISFETLLKDAMNYLDKNNRNLDQ